MKNRNNLQIDNFVTPRFWIPSQNAKRQVLNPILGLQIYAEVDWLAVGVDASLGGGVGGVDPPLPDAGEPRVHAGQQQGQLQHQGEGGQQQGSLLRPRQG